MLPFLYRMHSCCLSKQSHEHEPLAKQRTVYSVGHLQLSNNDVDFLGTSIVSAQRLLLYDRYTIIYQLHVIFILLLFLYSTNAIEMYTRTRCRSCVAAAAARSAGPRLPSTRWASANRLWASSHRPSAGTGIPCGCKSATSGRTGAIGWATAGRLTRARSAK